MKTLEYRDDVLWLIDQSKLPHEVEMLPCRTVDDVAVAISQLRVRGAPAIGCAAAYGVVLGAHSLSSTVSSPEKFAAGLEDVVAKLQSTRPTASNLFWALDRMRRVASGWAGEPGAEIAAALRVEADLIRQEDEAANHAMARLGADLIPDTASILTHCNTGPLAASAVGTALGAVIEAHKQGKNLHVWVDETRPLLQGSRLTTWELTEAGVPHTLITDSMAGHFMARGDVDLVMVGADRIAANGDTANKIGTYSLATLAHAHRLLFYVVAPCSTVDLATASGDGIPIEERNHDEVRTIAGTLLAPRNVQVANPAFDVTPARLISAIVTERCVVRPPYLVGFAELFGRREAQTP